jgi:hypothetical protein
MPLRIYIMCVLLSCIQLAQGQKILYSDLDKDDPRVVDFDIVGKLSDNILVYKNYGTHHFVCIYDESMKLVAKNEMTFITDKTINTDVIAYKDFFYLIYQYQKRNIVYCMAARINAQGEIEGNPKQLDTTAISVFATNKLYTVLSSEDKQKIDVVKINSKDQNRYVVTSSLFDVNLNLIKKDVNQIPMPERNDFLNEFQLDNKGNLIFLRLSGTYQNDNINQITLLEKLAGDTNIIYHPIPVVNVYLDNLKVKIDNIGGHYLIASYFSKTRRGNIDGLYANLWNVQKDTTAASSYITFSEELRQQAKSNGDGMKAALNNYFIQKIILRKDGGFIIISESVSSTSHGNPFNRWDYLYSSPFMSPGNYYFYNSFSPYSYYGYNPWFNNGGSMYGYTRYFADNITALSFDSSGKTEWTNVLHKSQYDDNTDNLLGFTLLNTGGELHFLFNDLVKRHFYLSDQSITPDGQLHVAPTLHGLDENYEFMPRYAKQVGAHETIIPCTYRNSICFGKIDF